MNNYTGEWYSPSRVLWLTKVKLSEDGRPISGWVSNGNWHWRLKGNEEWACFDKSSKKPVNSWKRIEDDWEKCK